MEKKSLKRNYIYNFLYQILLLLTPVITTPYISRVLGADGIGNVSYTESVASYFVLFATLGITTYGQREISYVQDSREKRSSVFWNVKTLEFCTSIIALIVYICFALFQEKTTIYLIYSFNIIAVFVDVTWFFQGMEEFGKIISRNVIFKVINIIYIFTFVKSSQDVLFYAFGLCFFTFISNASLWVYLPRYIDKIKFSKLHPLNSIPTVLSLFIPTIAIQVYTVLDKTMIGIITKSALENGYYEQALKISKMVLTIVTALGTVMVPRIGYHFENRQHDEVKRLMYRGYRFVWFLGIPLCLGLTMTATNFVPWFLGTGYYKVADLLKIFSFLILAIGINNVTGMQYLIPTKRQNIFTITVIIGAVTNFILNAILIGHLQAIGAAIASVVAETVIAVSQLVIVRKELNLITVLKEGIHYYIAGTIMAIGLWFISGKLTPSICHTAVIVISGAILYFVSLFIMRDEFLISNLRVILIKLRR